MKGLLLKEWYVLKSIGKIQLALLIVFTALGCVEMQNLFIAAYPCVLSGMMAMSLMAYDERDHWNLYAAALPYTDAQLVSAKYLISLILGVLAVACVASAHSIYSAMSGIFSLSRAVSFALMLIPLALLPSALLLPFLFRYGVEKGRMLYYAIMVLFFGGVTFLGDAGEMSVDLALIALTALAAFGFSWYLSIGFYQKRKA